MKWSEFVSSPTYATLTDEQRANLRERKFNKTVSDSGIPAEKIPGT